MIGLLRCFTEWRVAKAEYEILMKRVLVEGVRQKKQ